MKSPDAPALEPSHPLTPKLETRFNVKAESEEYTPRYLELPRSRRVARAGQRNLLWGVALICAALLVLTFAVLMGGPRAVLWPIVALMTFTALWVLARLRLFHQRNGVFLALAVVALLGSVLAIGERAFNRLADTHPGQALPNVSTTDSTEAQTGTPVADEPPLLSEAFQLTPPDPTEGSRVKILQDTQVTIARKSYRIQAGETFPLDGAKDGQVSFVAGEYRAKVPQANAQILGPQRNAGGAKTAKTAAKATPPIEAKPKERDPADIEIERRARAEALRRFPALSSPNSPENKEFLAAYNQLKEKNSSMLDDPEWPIRLAESLAQQSKWEETSDSPDAPDAPAASPVPSIPNDSADEVVGRGGPPPPPPTPR